jgi:hypothetical protein
MIYVKIGVKSQSPQKRWGKSTWAKLSFSHLKQHRWNRVNSIFNFEKMSEKSSGIDIESSGKNTKPSL